ncbi:hypothetical protein evm_012126 [Chilo suppressalis]|nr:hypothetical protein evm_012126 [Chilo suppressalis]
MCMNTSDKRSDISYFMFPLDAKMRKAWLTAFDRLDLLKQLSDPDPKTRLSYRVCEEHFEKKFIKCAYKCTGVKNKIKFLCSSAMPTRKLQSICEPEIEVEKLSDDTNPIEIKEEIFDEDTNGIEIKEENKSDQIINQPDNKENIKFYDDTNQTGFKIKNEPQEIKDYAVTATTSAYQCDMMMEQTSDILKDYDELPVTNTNKLNILKKESLDTTVTGNDESISKSKSPQISMTFSLANKWESAYKTFVEEEINANNPVTKDYFLKLCDKFLDKGMSQIIKWQLDSNVKHTENLYNRQSFKYFALSLHYLDPTAFNFFTNTFSLPSLKTLTKSIKEVGTKINERLLHIFKSKVDIMHPREKICSVCIGSMPVKGNLFYNISTDQIIGFHEVNGIQKPRPAKYVIVIIVNGIIYKWKQAVAHSFVTDFLNYPEIEAWIEETMVHLIDIGLDIRAFVTDLDFMSAKALSVNGNNSYFEFKGRKIYYIYDAPCLMKRVRDNLKECPALFDNKVAKWVHIKVMYYQDKDRQRRLAPKLTRGHIHPITIQKEIAKLAIEVLSETVACALKTYADMNEMDKGAYDTAEYLSKFNKLFDILNSSTLKSTNIFKKAFRGNNYQIRVLKEMLHFFNNLKLIVNNHVDNTDTATFIKGFEVTINSVLKLHEELLLEGIDYIFTRNLNKDCVESLFDKVRQLSSSQVPTCRKFSIAFRKIFIRDFLEKSETKDIDSNKLSKRKSKAIKLPLLKPEPLDLNLKLAVGDYDYRFNFPDKNELIYVAGYLSKKCFEKHACVKMSQNFTLKSPVINYNENYFYVIRDFAMIPPDNMLAFVAMLEQKFCEYFQFVINIVNLGNELFNYLKHFRFGMTCECFPTNYCIKLYIRFRIYHTLKVNNVHLKRKNGENIIKIDRLQ